MEQERHLRRPWPERTAAPLLAPALAMLGACAAVDVSPWFWGLCLCWALLPCLFRTPSMSLLAVALAVWAVMYLLAYNREYGNVPVEAGRTVAMEVSGKSVLFRPDGSRWLYAVSSRDGACPLAVGERYRIEGETYPLQAPCGPGIFDRERWGYLHGVIAGIRLDDACRVGPGDWAQPPPGVFPAAPGGGRRPAEERRAAG